MSLLQCMLCMSAIAHDPVLSVVDLCCWAVSLNRCTSLHDDSTPFMHG